MFPALYQRTGEDFNFMKKRYLNIPYEVLFNNNFDAENKIILSEIIALSKLPDGCIKSDERFGELVNLKRTAVNGRMNGLVKDGYIKRINRKNRSTVKTVLSKNFWELVRKGIIKEKKVELEIEDNDGLPDTLCHLDHIEGVIETQINSHQDDTINTTTNTDILIQEELQYTGGTETPVDNFITQYQSAGKRIIELMIKDPEQISNPFIKQFQDRVAGLYLFFGESFLDNFHVFKTNQELYGIYGTSNFYEVRDDLMFVKENMEKFLRYKTFE